MTIALFSGAFLGAVCALLVAGFGIMFIKTNTGSYGEQPLKDFFRGILGVVSAVIAAVGLITAALAGGLPFYFGWLLSYGAGLAIYFVVRYRVLKRA